MRVVFRTGASPSLSLEVIPYRHMSRRDTSIPGHFTNSFKSVSSHEDAVLGCSKMNARPALCCIIASSTAKLTIMIASAHSPGHRFSGNPLGLKFCNEEKSVQGGHKIRSSGLSCCTRRRAQFPLSCSPKSFQLPGRAERGQGTNPPSAPTARQQTKLSEVKRLRRYHTGSLLADPL